MSTEATPTPTPLPTVDEIIAVITAEFATFGDGRGSEFNPIAEVLKNAAPTFALGVPVRHVVERVVQMLMEPVTANNKLINNKLEQVMARIESRSRIEL